MKSFLSDSSESPSLCCLRGVLPKTMDAFPACNIHLTLHLAFQKALKKSNSLLQVGNTGWCLPKRTAAHSIDGGSEIKEPHQWISWQYASRYLWRILAPSCALIAQTLEVLNSDSFFDHLSDSTGSERVKVACVCRLIRLSGTNHTQARILPYYDGFNKSPCWLPLELPGKMDWAFSCAGNSGGRLYVIGPTVIGKNLELGFIHSTAPLGSTSVQCQVVADVTGVHRFAASPRGSRRN